MTLMALAGPDRSPRWTLSGPDGELFIRAVPRVWPSSERSALGEEVDVAGAGFNRKGKSG